MTIVHSDMGLYIDLKENIVNVVVVENKRMLSNLTNELYIQCNGGYGEFVLAEKDKLFKFSEKVVFVPEPFSISCNDKKILSLLHKELCNEALNNLYEETSSINLVVTNYMEDLVSRLPYPIIFSDDLDILGLLKLMHISFDDYSETLCEKIINYIKILSSLTKFNTIVFLNLKAFLDDWELKEVYKIAFYNKIHIVLIESYLYDKLDSENTIIFDKDLCVIEF